MLGRMLRERARARAISGLGPLDAPSEPGLNRFAEQAANAFAAPLAFVTVLHDQQLLVKGGVELAAVCLPRKEAFCHYAVDRNDLLEVCDALADPFFRTLPCVAGASHVRYYVGAPLTIARNVDVGMLCVLDTVPRSPASRDQRTYLAGLARQAAQAIERRVDRKGCRAA